MPVPQRVIIVDSCCDLPPEKRGVPGIKVVPFSMRLEGKEYLDDDNLDVAAFVAAMGESAEPPKSSCPSPYDFHRAFTEGEELFVVTISSQLSSSFNSAVLARSMALEEKPDRRIHIFDSKSASAGESLILFNLERLLASEISFDAIVKEMETFIDGMQTYFLLESLEHLAKAGRLKPVVAKLADFFAIKPIMGSNNNGEIEAVEKIKGYQRALQRLAVLTAEGAAAYGRKEIAIAQCNCPERGEKLAAMLKDILPSLEVTVVPTMGSVLPMPTMEESSSPSSIPFYLTGNVIY